MMAQSDSLDSRGKEFYVTFIPNYHDRIVNSLPADDLDSLFLFFACTKPTKITLNYRDKLGRIYSSLVNALNPNQVYSFRVHYDLFEIPGVNYKNTIKGSNSEIVVKPYFKITSDNDISVFGYSKAFQTHDAFLVLPTHSLAYHHFVMSYQSDYMVSRSLNESTPSEFAVLATKDNTQIKIVPACRTWNPSPDTIRVTLNEGDSYIVSAYIDSKNPKLDLTGSEIFSDKPIALFSGHERAFVPNNPDIRFSSDNTPSRDIIIEQIPAINYWGRHCFVVPFHQSTSNNNKMYDVYRVMAAFDSTEVKVNGVLKYILNKGKFFEEKLNSTFFIESSKPVLGAGFKKTSIDPTPPFGDRNKFYYGDPFMLLFPPKEQFAKSYLVINPQVYDYSSNGRNYSLVKSIKDQFITIIAPDNDLINVTIDNTQVLGTWGFSSIDGGSNYSFSHIPVSDGTHSIKSKSELGIYIYGFGIVNSYGYLGGLAAKKLDFNPPEIYNKYQCPSIFGYILDTNIYDTGMYSIETPKDSMFNTKAVYFNDTSSGLHNVNFRIDLVNPYLDGSIQMVARDSMGITQKKWMDLPGFTIANLGSKEDSSKYYIFSDSVSFHKPICRNFTIENYGRYPHTFTVKLQKDTVGFSLVPITITLKPGETRSIQFCFDALDTGKFDDNVLVEDSCLVRKVASLHETVYLDRDNPQIQDEDINCIYNKLYTISDTLAYNSGILRVDFIDSTNIFVIKKVNSLSQIVGVNISMVDITKDASYKMIVVDSSGKTSEIDKTIHGITLNIGNGLNFTNLFSLDTAIIGNIKCAKLPIFNYGIYPITIQSGRISHNTVFSMLYRDFPVTINPQSSDTFDICYSPLQDPKIFDFDTLKLDINCYDKPIILKGRGIGYIINSQTDCKVTVKIKVNKIYNTGLSVISISPNPSPGIVNVEIELGNQSNIVANVYSQLGEMVLNPLNTIFDQGEYTLSFDLSQLTSGTYYLILRSGIEENIQKIYLVK